MTIPHLLVPAALTLSLVAGCSSAKAVEQVKPSQAKPTQPTPPPPSQAKPAADAPPNQVAKEMVDFVARVEAYNTMREKLTGDVPKLSEKATPEEIDKHQRALAALIVVVRKEAKPGDVFVPDMQTVVRALMARVFKSSEQRAELKASIAEENPSGLKVVINTRYPEGIPLATMPPEVLKNLPKLPKEFEYRFVGESLILLDTRSYLVVDVMSFALPKL